MKSGNSKYESRPSRSSQLIKKRSPKLKENGEELKSVFRASPDAIIVTSLNGRIIDCNQATLEMCGAMKKEELVGRAALDFIAEKDRPEAAKILKDIMQLGTVRNLEYKLLDSAGREYPAEISCSVVEDASGKPVSLVAIYKDITGRKKAEAAFIASENRYKSVVDNIAIGVSLISPKMEILALNRQMENWFPDVDVSKNPICYKVFNNPPRDEVCSYCPTYKTLKDGEVHESITTTPRNDKTINFRVISSPIRDKEDKVVGAIEMVDDVTERMRLEQELKLHSQNLEAAVQERTHRLTESEEHFHSLFENVPDGIYRSSPSGKFLTANQALVRMFGYDSLEEFLTIDIARDLYVNKKDRLAWQKKLEKDGELRNAELVLKRKNGQKLVVLENTSVTRDAYDNVLYYEGTLTDITERKMMEERLSALNVYGGKLNAAKSLDEVYELTLDVMENTLGFGHASFLTVRNEALVFEHQRGYAAPSGFELPLDGSRGGITVKAATSRKTALLGDVSKDPEYVQGAKNIPPAGSELAVPVMADNELLGVMNVESDDLEAFDQNDVLLLEILASHAAAAITDIKRRHELEKQTMQQASLMKSSAEMIRSNDLHQRLQAILDAIHGLGWGRVVLPVRNEKLDIVEREDIVTAGLTSEERAYLWKNRQSGKVWSRAR